MDIVGQLISLENELDIVVIDSSDEKNDSIMSRGDIVYCRTTHKNQPYQRYLGYHMAKGKYLLFLDDDMELLRNDLFSLFDHYIEETDIVGLALSFNEAHKSTTLSNVPKSTLVKKGSLLHRIKNFITGNPELSEGKLGYNGIKGKQPKLIKPTEYVSGGAFLAKRSTLYKNFNFLLFDLYENNIGKGEDTAIGYTLSRQGKILHIPDPIFLHNDQQNSVYSSNLFSFGKRVMYSRLYLTLEKCRLDGKSMVQGRLYYHWYSAWRLLGLALNFFKSRTLERKQVLSGNWKGWCLAIKFKFTELSDRAAYWQSEAVLEAKKKA